MIRRLLNPPRAVGLAARLLLGALFAYAGAVKFADPAAFAQEIANYRLLPDLAVGPLAIFLPGVEIIAGLTLIAGLAFAQRGAIVLIEGMLAVFTLAIIQAILRGIDTSCGCFGVTEQADPIGWTEVIRDLLMMLTGLLCWPAPSATQEAAS